jgi:hypothetical protein
MFSSIGSCEILAQKFHFLCFSDATLHDEAMTVQSVTIRATPGSVSACFMNKAKVILERKETTL